MFGINKIQLLILSFQKSKPIVTVEINKLTEVGLEYLLWAHRTGVSIINKSQGWLPGRSDS